MNQMRKFMEALNASKSKTFLEEAISGELTAISQYTLHAAILESLGESKLAEKERTEASEEQVHAMRFSKRLLELNFSLSTPKIKPLLGTTIDEILMNDLKGEEAAIDLYSRASNELKDSDPETAKLFSEILKDEQDHKSFLENELINRKL